MIVLKKDSKKKLASHVVLTLVLGFACQSMTHAAEHSTVYVSGGGKQMFEVLYYNQGDALYLDPNKSKTDENNIIIGPAGYNLPAEQKTALEKGLSYWAEMLGEGSKNKAPVQVLVSTELLDGSASASNISVDFTNKKTYGINYVKESLQNGMVLEHFDPFDGTDPSGDKNFSVIRIGQYLGVKREGVSFGWYADADTVLPENEECADYLGTVRHEMGHALGIMADLQYEMKNNSEYKRDDKKNRLAKFAEDENKETTAWNMHLVDQNLNKATPGMSIVTTAQFNEIKKNNPNAKVSDYFILDNRMTDAPYDETNTRSGKMYFIGDNVTDALNGATFDGVSGLPVNGWEWEYDKNEVFLGYQPEFSHIQTPGMMSHVDYSNYTSFMEVELALMQDIGYDIDRRNYFGFSEYDNGRTYINNNGYSARNTEGTAYLPGVYNQTPLGIGLHVYGSNNNITQAADILTQGDGAVGIRIDGVGNTITVAKDTQVKADGYRGIGALIAYGNNQVLNQEGTITANGKQGVGVRFDFGSSSNGARDEYRGSYIRFKRTVNSKTGALSSSENISFGKKNGVTEPTPELNGALVKEYNLSGKLVGTANAIYIGKNALVQNINVLDKATISGNITSEWKHFTDANYHDIAGDGSDAIKIQYNGTEYAYDQYIPNLVTNLNFNADTIYTGDIKGSDNMKLHVKGGSLYYTGTADVISVEVDKDASLLGSGSYYVNDLTKKLVAGFTDKNMGKVINHGFLGATHGNVVISGDLISDGSINVVSGNNGADVYQLQVSGTANITNSDIVANEKNKPLLNRTYTYLEAEKGITGNIGTVTLSDYVEAIGEVNGTEAIFTTRQTKKLEDTKGLNKNETALAKAFNNVAQQQMAKNDAIGQQAGNVFYNNASGLKKLLNSASGTERIQLLGQSAMSSLTSNSIYSRLDTNAFEGNVSIPVNVPSLAGENQTVTGNLPMVLDATNNFWFKLFRGFENYGGTDGTSDLNDSSFGGVVGYDREMKSDWRLGGFFAYGKTNYSSTALQGDSNDWRLGIYTGARKGDWEYQGLASYGNNHYDLDGYTSDGGEKLNSDFKAKVWDLAFKAKYTLPGTKTKTWQVKPYGKLEYTHTSQEGYSETGNNAFAKNIDSASNNSTRAEIGIEFKCKLNAASGWGGALGYKRVLSGVNPQLNGSFIGSTENFSLETENDRNYLTYSLNVHTALGGKWTGQAEFRGEKSSNNHKEVYSIAAKYHF